MAEKWEIEDMKAIALDRFANACYDLVGVSTVRDKFDLHNSEAYKAATDYIRKSDDVFDYVNPKSDTIEMLAEATLCTIANDEGLYDFEIVHNYPEELVADMEKRLNQLTGLTPEEEQDRVDATERTIDRIVDYAVEARLTRKPKD